MRYALSGLGCASEQQLRGLLLVQQYSLHLPLKWQVVAAAAAGGFSLCIGLDVEGVVYGVTETNS